MEKLNKKGFTLVELIGVITILSIISTISVVSITGMLKESNKTECDSIVKNLKSAVKEYVSDNRYEETLGSSVKIETLMSDDYFGDKVINPFTNEQSLTLKDKYISYQLSDEKTVKRVIITFINCEDEIFPN